jgi:predicted CopG family antitoxin
MIDRLLPINVSHESNNMRKLTTISLTRENYQRLQNLRKVPESFNDVISRLLDEAEKEKG